METIDQHVRQRQVELARSIKDRRKLYLDVRFWIIALLLAFVGLSTLKLR